MKQYIVDAFTDTPFSGNPAAVCVMDRWPSDESMKKLAMENNLSETAFVVREETGYRLRWFTPETEVELCGHATLASSFVILNFYEPELDTVRFHTLSGPLTVRKRGSLYEMNFPTYELREIPVTDAMERAFGVRPVKAVLGLDLICVFENEELVRSMRPDSSLLTKIEGRIQNATAPLSDQRERTACPRAAAGDIGARGSELPGGGASLGALVTSLGRSGPRAADCVSRSFCPKLGVAEDPVCGSAHCQIADYWARELNRTHIVAYQASKRGGVLYCDLLGGGRIAISGEAALVAVSEIVAEL